MNSEVQRIVLVEDHEMMLEGLMAVFASDPRIMVAATASSLEEFGSVIADSEASLVVADHNLPDGVGTELPSYLERLGMSIPVLIMSGIPSPSVLTAAVKAGCAGYVSKASRVSTLIDACVAVAGGASVFPGEVIGDVLISDLTSVGATLTGREMQVLELLARAMTAAQIAQRLGVSLATVRNHIRSILTKLHAQSQLEAVITALRAGIVALPSSD